MMPSEAAAPSPISGMRPDLAVIDRCWALPFLAACSAFFFAMPHTTSGILYVIFMEKFRVSREAALWPRTIQSVTASIMGFPIGALQRKMSIYSIIVIGTWVGPVALVTSAFVPNIEWMSVTFGFLYGKYNTHANTYSCTCARLLESGVSAGILWIATSIYIVSYFHEHRSLAIGIMSLGYSLSGVAGASLLPHLFRTYGFDGATLVFGGIVLHLIPLVLMHRTPRPSRVCLWKFRTTIENPDKQAAGAVYGTIQKNSENVRRRSLPQSSSLLRELSSKFKYQNNKTGVDGELEGSLDFVPSTASQIPLPSPTSHNNESSQGMVLQILGLLETPCFYVILVSMVAGDFTSQIFNSTIVDYARDKGIPLNKSSQLVACSSAGSICGQVLIPLVFDRLARSRCTTAAFSFAVVSLCFLVIPFLHDFVATSALTFIAGFQHGYIKNLKAVLAADYLGTHHVAVSSGFVGLSGLPLTFCEPVIVGVFRDSGGSYDNLYRLCAVLCIMAVFVLAVQSSVDSRNRTRHNRTLPHV
ncbi:monocarboxylate transporter 14-like [Haemaphysalis longicornis]